MGMKPIDERVGEILDELVEEVEIRSRELDYNSFEDKEKAKTAIMELMRESVRDERERVLNMLEAHDRRHDGKITIEDARKIITGTGE